jgi:flagellar biosynthetic protein FliO
VKSNLSMKHVWIGVFAILAVCAMGLVMITTNSPSADASITAGTIESFDQTAQSPAQETFAAEAGSSIMRMIVALAIVLACIYGCVFLLKRFGPNKTGRSGEKRMLEMIDSISVGPKKMIAVVRVGERAVVVGITDTQMTSLSELDKDELPDGCFEKTTERKTAPQTFANLFSTIWNGPVKATKMTDSQTTQVA